MCLVPKAGDREEGQARRQSTKLGVRLVYKAGGKTGGLVLEVGRKVKISYLFLWSAWPASRFLGRDRLRC